MVPFFSPYHFWRGARPGTPRTIGGGGTGLFVGGGGTLGGGGTHPLQTDKGVVVLLFRVPKLSERGVF